jgi:hypothetical protein
VASHSELFLEYAIHFPRRQCSATCLEIKENNNIPTLPWPAQSPDINIIENSWLLLKNQVKRQITNIDTVNDLKAVPREDPG